MRITRTGGLGEAGDQLAKMAQKKKTRVMVFQGSARNAENCPDQWGKTLLIIKHAIKKLPEDVDIDYCDLSVGERPIIQPCKGCISTAGGFHCHWPCSCYAKHDKRAPDFMHDNDVYSRLLKADGFIVFTPINWYAPSNVVKSMFDRIVCANLTITKEQAEHLYGEENIKNSEKTRTAEKSGKYHHLLKNHLEGKVAAFFIHGDDGAADYRKYSKNSPEGTPEMPPSLARNLNKSSHDEGSANDPRIAIRPILWQCRYSGIEVPDDLVIGMHVNHGLSYSEANEKTDGNNKLIAAGRELLLRLIATIRKQNTTE